VDRPLQPPRVAGLEEVLRRGRPRGYVPEDVGAVVQAALTPPRKLGLPFASWKLDRCATTVEDMVRGCCWPALSVDEKPRKPSRVAAGWGIRNLLGAMYLQMYRLMAAGEEVTTCRYCGKVISLIPSKIGDRKVRQDKKYCDDACRQRYHYHNRVKPRRQKRQSS
jgi:hypothetical protein